MAQIMNIEEFIKKYNKLLTRKQMQELLTLLPGESDVVAFGTTRREDVVFVRVTLYHMATMSVYEFNGIR